MAPRGQIQHGDEAKDTITGLVGIVIAITTWINGCERITIQPKEIKDGKPVDASTFDVEQVEVVTRAVQTSVADAFKHKTGGDRDNIGRARDIR